MRHFTQSAPFCRIKYMADLTSEELIKLNKELEEAKRKLEELNHLKNHLLSLASHQVKAPLAAIKGYAALLKQGAYGEASERQKEILGKIEFAADDIIKMVTNIIDLKKIEEGRLDYKLERVNFGHLADEAVEELHPLALNKNLKFDFYSPPEDIFVLGDPRELRHAIQNLVDNAIKYTPNGFVKAKVAESDGNAVFSVEDSGIGIPAGVKPLIFEEFVRDERVKSEIRGSGIGLHIAKSIIEAHGGKIWAESKGEGQGSTFYFSLLKMK
jgi:signal transduction histidine kinase